MEGSPSVFPDWAHLPQLVVQLISEKIKSITDYVRFRAVCCPWRSASLSKPRHLPPQLPWLMNPQWYSIGKNDDNIRLFYNPWESKIHRLHLPESNKTMCCAYYRGWLLLLTLHESQAFLLNPLTRARIQLPPLSTPLKHLGYCWDDSFNDCFVIYTSVYGIGKMSFSMDPTHPDCVITVLLQRYRMIVRCQVRDSCWTRIHIRPNVLMSQVVDTTYYNGRFYFLYEKAMEIIEPNNPEERVVYNFEPEVEAGNGYLLEGEESGIYIIISKNLKRGSIKLFQFQEQPFKLNKITDLSNTAFFHSHYICLPLCSDRWDSLDGGSAYTHSDYAPPAWGLLWAVWFQPSFI